MKAEEFLKHKITVAGSTRCMIGGETLSTTTTGRQTYLDGFACDDHYFEKVGEVVERQPIRSPRLTRRT